MKISRKGKVAGAACLAVGLVSTWDSAQAADYSFTGSITPTHTLSDIYFVFSVGACQGGGTYSAEIASSFPANVTSTFSFTVTGVIDGIRNPGDGTLYSIGALYDPENGGVAVAYNPTTAANLFSDTPAPEWDGVFMPGDTGNNLYYAVEGGSEPDIAASLASGNFDNIMDGQDDLLAPSTGAPDISDFTLVDFSGASFGGTGTLVEVVPEPASMAVALVGLAGLGLHRARRKRSS